MHSHVDADRTLGFALKRLQQTLRARMDACLAEFGLTAPQYAVLALLETHPGISNSELARRSFVAAPTMIRMVTALAGADLVTKAEATREQRVRRLELTDAGRARLTEAAGQVQRLEDILVGQLDAEQLDVVLSWLRRCADRLDELPDAT